MTNKSVLQKYIAPFLTVPFAFLKKDLIMDTSYRISFVTRWIGIVISVITFYYLSHLIYPASSGYLAPYGGDYFSFVVIGLAAISYLNSNVHGFVGTVLMEQRSGAMEIFLTSPTKISVLFFGFCLHNIVMGILAATLYMLLGVLLGIQLSHVSVLAVTVIFVLGSLCFLSLGALASSFIIAFRRGDPVTWVVTNVFWLLGGAYFPITVFPKTIQKISYLLPSTYIFDSLRFALLKGYSFEMLWGHISTLGFFALVLISFSVGALQSALYYARKRGSITFH